MFRGALAELSGHSWLQNFLIGLALLLIWPLIGVTVMKSYRATIIGFGLGITILVWIGVIVLLHQAKETDDAKPSAPVDTRKDRPRVFFNLTMLKKPLTVGEKAVIQFVLRNNGTKDAHVTFRDNTYYFNVKPFKDNFAYQPYAPTSADIAAGQDINGELRFDWVATKDKLAALESGDAQLLFYARGEYLDDNGKTYPLPFCRMWDKDINGNLILCPDGVKLAENSDQDKKGECPTEFVPDALAKSEPVPAAKRVGHGSGAPSITWQSRYPRFKWTDYTEDYFYDAVWRWKYRPEMGGKEPRDIRPSCPECDSPLRKIGGTSKVDLDKGRTVSLQCGQHVRLYHFQSLSYDDFDGIRELILERLQNGQWEEVVKRQYDARSGIV